MDIQTVDQEELHGLPTLSEALEKIKETMKISNPTTILSYSRAIISILFLGYLGELELTSGFLSITIMNMTGYSVIHKLALEIEPICGRAYGAKQWMRLILTLQRRVFLILFASIDISFMWLNTKRFLLWCGQDEETSSMAHIFIVLSIPDLFFLSILHPLQIYLRIQSKTLPLNYFSAISVPLHILLNFLLVVHFKLGIAGVAIAMVLTNLSLFLLLFSFVFLSGTYKDSWVPPSMDCLQGSSLLVLAVVKILIQWTQSIQKILEILIN